MKNLNSLFLEHNLYNKTLLEAYSDRHLVRLKMSEKYPHLGILHYRDDIVYDHKDWNDFAKTCRGVVVDFPNKKIKTHGLHKFWNVGEAEAPSFKEMATKAFTVMEKLDGSCILLFHDDVTNQFIATTKGSLDSEQGAWATPRIPESVKDKALLTKYTLVFEMLSKQYQIVVPYSQLLDYHEGLYLIGVRENISENLFEPDDVKAFAKEYGLDTFKTYEFPSIEAILDKAKTLPYSQEGYVIRFKGEETQVKIKSMEYLRVHRFLGSLTDSNLLDLLIAGQEQQIHDNMYAIPEEYRQDVEDTLKRYKRTALDFKNACYAHFADIISRIPEDTQKDKNGKRKSFAAEVQKIDDRYKGFLFRLYDNKHPDDTQILMYFKKEGL